MKLFAAVLAAASILAVAQCANAADISSPNERMIDITGPIVDGDFGTFKTILAEHGDTVVVMVGESPGGILIEAMAIGELINKKGLRTVVQGRCLSACALIFMSGVKKGMGEGSILAFHAPAHADGSRSTGGAALSGAYLHGLGVGYDFIYAANSADGKLFVIKPSDIDFLADEWNVYFFPVTTESELEFFLK